MALLNRRNPQVVVITGATAGVGRATALAFARRGACIGLIARGRQRLHDTVAEVEANGGKAIALPLDVANPDEMEEAADIVEETFGPIDIWVNNAMTSVFSRVSQMQPREYKRVTEVTYLGVVYGTLAALKRMKRSGPNGRGCIIQVGSALAYRSIPLQSAYCAAKHAIVGFTDSLRSELIDEQSNIRISMVHLPGLNTPQFGWVKSRLPGRAQPVPPIFQPELAADAIVHASQHPRREYFVGQPTVNAVTGQKFIPGWLDRYLARNTIDGQQLDEPEDPHRLHNLWEPVPGPYAAHGTFDHRARRHSIQWFFSKYRRPLTMLAVAAGLGITAAAVARKKPASMRPRNRRPIATQPHQPVSNPAGHAGPAPPATTPPATTPPATTPPTPTPPATSPAGSGSQAAPLSSHLRD